MTIKNLGEVYRAFIKEDIRLAAEEEDIEKYGHPFTVCTNIAVWLRDHLLHDAQVVGYLIDDPESKLIGAGNDGHDFLVVDDRYILDFWPRVVLDRKHPIAYDLHTQKELIIQHYGYSDNWTVRVEDFQYWRVLHPPLKANPHRPPTHLLIYNFPNIINSYKYANSN